MALAPLIHGRRGSGVVLRAAVGFGLMALLAPPLQALRIDVSVSSVDDQGIELLQTGQLEIPTPGPDGLFNFGLGDLPAHISSTGRWQFSDFSGSSNEGPSIAHSFGITSLLPGKQTLTLTLSLPTGPIGAASTMTGGSAQGGVTDQDGDGATVSTSGPGTAFYTSLIDGEDFMSLYTDSAYVSVDPFSNGNLSPGASFGMPLSSFPGPTVASSIGIRFTFDLTDSDQATGSGVFVVGSVPEPASGLLFGLGLAALLRRRPVASATLRGSNATRS